MRPTKKLSNVVTRVIVDAQALKPNLQNFKFFPKNAKEDNPVINYVSNPFPYTTTLVTGFRFSLNTNILTQAQLAEFYNAIVKIKKGTYESFEADLATLMRIRIKDSFLLQDGTEKLVVEYEDVPFRFGKKPLRFGDNDHFEVLVTFKSMSQNNIDLRCHFYAMTTDRVIKPSN